MGNDDYVSITVDVLYVTDSAVLVTDGDEDSNIWLPLSQIVDSDNLEPGQEGAEIMVAEWLALKKGLI